MVFLDCFHGRRMAAEDPRPTGAAPCPGLIRRIVGSMAEPI